MTQPPELLRLLSTDSPSLPLSEALQPPPATALPNPAAVYHDAKAPGSRPAIRAVLNRIAGWLLGKDSPCSWEETIRVPWWEVRARHVGIIRARLVECAAPRTVNRDLSLLRSVLATAWASEMLSTDAYQHAIHVKGVDKDKSKAGRQLEISEVRRMVQTGRAWSEVDRNGVELGPRALAVLALMYAGGLRRAEVAGVLKDGIDLENGTIALIGKRQKRRVAYLGPGWGNLIGAWARKRVSGPRLIGVKSPESIGRIIEELRVKAGVKPFTPHDLRRSYGTHLLDAKNDLSIVRDLMGHDDIRTTMLYDRRGELEMKRAMESFPGPDDGSPMP